MQLATRKEKNKRRLLCFVLTLVTLIPLLALTPDALIGRAAWSEGTGYNLSSWESYNATNWKGNSTGSECYFNYTQDINNFKSWSFKANLDSFYFSGLWGLSGIKQETWIKIQNRNNLTQSIEGYVSHNVYFTLIGTLGYDISWNFPGFAWFTPRTFPVEDVDISVNLTKLTNIKMGLEIRHPYKADNPPIVGKKTYDVPSGFFNNVTLSIRIYKRLQLATVGWVQGSKTDEVIASGSAFGDTGWYTGPLDFKISTWPSIVSLVTPGIILGGIAGVFAMAGSRLGGHGVAGFMIGGCLALVMLAQSGLMPSWLFAVIVLIGAVGIYFWWK